MNRSRKNLPAGERRAVTVAAVVGLAGEQNPSEITTAAIASRMGLTQGALFRHFSGKDAIFGAVMEWVSEHLLSRIGEAVSLESSASARLERVFLSHIDFIISHPGVPRMLFGELQHPDETAAKRVVQSLLRRYGEILVGLFEQGKASGEFAAQLDCGSAATLFIGTIQGLVMQSLITGNLRTMRDNAAKAFAIYQRGIRGTS